MYCICSTICFYMAQSTVTIRVDDSLKRSFDALCNDFGFSNTAAFTIFMKAVVRERRIPFEIKAESEEEKKEKLLLAIDRMRKAAEDAGLSDMSLEEINEEIRLSREGK